MGIVLDQASKPHGNDGLVCPRPSLSWLVLDVASDLCVDGCLQIAQKHAALRMYPSLFFPVSRTETSRVVLTLFHC